MPAKNSETNKIYEDLNKAVSEGTFVPFIGPQASTMRSGCFPEWNGMLTRLEALVYDINNKVDEAENKGCLSYLESLAKAYRFEDEFNSFSSVANKPVDSFSDPLLEKHLATFRLYLVIIGSRMVKLFGESMAGTRPSVENLWDYKVDVKGKEEDIQAILKDIVKASIELSNYNQANRKTRIKNEQSFEVDLVYKKLLWLAKQIGSHLGEKLKNLLGDEYKKVSESDIIESDKGYLRLDQLAWLEDLLWYALRFDVPDYLDAKEMTFRFSLRLHGLTRRESLQVVTSTWVKPSPREDIERWIKFCEPKRPPCDIHLVLAAAVWHKFETDNKRVSQLGSRDVLPFLFTTNFDRNLELAFQTLKKTYHVIFPIRVKLKINKQDDVSMKKGEESRSQKYSEPAIIWVLRTWQWGGSAYIMKPLMELPSKGDDLRRHMLGPMIVKLHGSPAEPLEVDAEDGWLSKYDDIKPYIILSEYDYLRTAVETQAKRIFPDIIINGIQVGSQWWFLGYPIDDLFIRLRIYQLISYTIKSASPPIVKVLDPDYDYFRSHVVEAWKVERLHASLSTVVDFLKEMREIKDILGELG